VAAIVSDEKLVLARGVRMTPNEVNGLLTGLGLATAMHFYVADGINLILVDMAGSVGASRSEAAWIPIAYSSALLVGTPIASYVARRIGIFHYLLGTIVAFVACSILCSSARTLEQMLCYRTLEGFAAAGLNFWWRGSVYTLMPGPMRSPALARMSVMLYSGTVVGLIAMGLLADFGTWRLVWVVDAAFGLIAITLLLRHFPRVDLRPPGHDGPADGIGIALLAIALVALEIVLGRGVIDDWFGSALLTALTWIGIVALVLFVARQFDPANPWPLLRLSLVRDRNVLAAVVFGVLLGMILSGALYAFPEYLRGVDPQPRSASQTGIVMASYAIVAAMLRPQVGKIIGRFGQRVTVVLAMCCLIVSMLLFARLLTTGTPAGYYVLPLILYGCCISPLLSAIGSGTASKAEPARQIDAVSVYMTVRQFGTTLGIVLVSVMLDRRETHHSARLFEALRKGGPVLDGWLGTVRDTFVARDGMSQADAARAAYRLLQEQGVQQAGALATADAFRVMALIGFVAILLVPLMTAPPAKKP
jgi:MFS transporter, DHA2 family, multidrug resistance protein